MASELLEETRSAVRRARPVTPLRPTAVAVWGLFAAVVLVVTAFALFIVRWSHPPLADLAHFAELGESFGLVSALFSGLAFAALIITILIQSRELSLQRQQLTLQRAELEGQRLELARLANAQDVQNYALVFSAFALAETHEMRFSSGGPSPEFAEAIRYLRSYLKEETARRQQAK